MKLLILGTCVSRDALEYVNDGSIELVDYYARSSFASLNAVPFTRELPSCLENIPSAFGRRVVERDLRKSFFESALDAGVDIVLVDLIDERFDLWVDDASGRCCTLSDEIVRAGFEATHGYGRTVRSGSAEFWDRWCAGWRRFFSYAERKGLARSIAINKVFWSERTNAGTRFHWGVTENNELLGRMYDHIARDVSAEQFLAYPRDLIVGDEEHRWGKTPFHYIPEFYQETIRLLHALDRSLCAAAEQYELVGGSRTESSSLIEEVEYTDNDIPLVTSIGLSPDGRDLWADVRDTYRDVPFTVTLYRNGMAVDERACPGAGHVVFDLNGREGMYWLGVCVPGDRSRERWCFSSPVAYRLPRSVQPIFAEGRSDANAWEHAEGDRAFSLCLIPGNGQRLLVLAGEEEDFAELASIVSSGNGMTREPAFDGAILCVIDASKGEIGARKKVSSIFRMLDDADANALATLIGDVAGGLAIEPSNITVCGAGRSGFSALRITALIHGAAGIMVSPLAGLTNRPVDERLAASWSVGSADAETAATQILRQDYYAEKLSIVHHSLDSRFSVFEKIGHRPAWEQLFYPVWASIGEASSDVADGRLSTGQKYLEAYWNNANVCSSNGEVLMKEMFRRLVSRDALYKIESLVLTSEVVWFEGVSPEESIVIRADLANYPAGKRGAALVVFEFGGEPDAAAIHDASISKSEFGYYRYLDDSVHDDVLDFSLTLEGLPCKRFGLRTWSWAYPVFLDNLACNHKPVKVNRVAKSYDRKSLAAWLNDDDGLPLLHGNLLSVCESCVADAGCANHNKRWHTNMENASAANRYYGIEEHLFEIDGQRVFAKTYLGNPSFLAVPKLHDDYLKFIGDSSRNMIRKAARLGYEYRVANPDDYPDDILEIRTSSKTRQGKQIPAYFYERPKSILLKHGCSKHREIFFAAFHEGKMRAYITMFCYGEILQINHILAHHDDMSTGVMNLLMSEAVKEIIETMPWVRGINYLYQGNVGAGLNIFKTGLGFRRSKVVIYDVGPGLDATVKRYLDAARKPDDVEAPVVRASVKAKKVGGKRIAGSEIDWHASNGVDEALRVIKEAGDLTGLVATGSGFASSDLPEGAKRIVIRCEGADVISYVLTKGLKDLGAMLEVGATVVFHISADESAEFDTRTLEFLRRRSGEDSLDIDSTRNMFKGSSFVPTRVYKYGGDHDKWSSLIEVDKVG